MLQVNYIKIRPPGGRMVTLQRPTALGEIIITYYMDPEGSTDHQHRYVKLRHDCGGLPNPSDDDRNEIAEEIAMFLLGGGRNDVDIAHAREALDLIIG